MTNDRLDVTVHDGFGFWVADAAEDPATAAALEQANAAASPSARLTTVEAAYWTDVGTKEHLRWVMPQPEAELLDALARLHAAGRDQVADDSRLVGMFRAHGLLVPVWDLPVGTGAEALEEPAESFAAALAEALTDASPDERGAVRTRGSRQPTGHAPQLTSVQPVSTGTPEPVAWVTPSGEAFRVEKAGGEPMHGQLTVELADLVARPPKWVGPVTTVPT